MKKTAIRQSVRREEHRRGQQRHETALAKAYAEAKAAQAKTPGARKVAAARAERDRQAQADHDAANAETMALLERWGKLPVGGKS